MPYTFYEGFGNYQVLNDLRLRGYYAGSSAAITLNPALPWGATSLTNVAINFANAGPGNNVNDPFCAPLSGKTMNELWNSGGFAVSWRQQTFIPNAHLRMPLWDGARYVWILGPAMSGSYVGTSPNGSYWQFQTAAGAQTEATAATGGVVPAVYDSVHSQIVWFDVATAAPNYLTANYGIPENGFSQSATIVGAGSTFVITGSYYSNGRLVVIGASTTSPYCYYSDNGGAGPWVAASGLTGNVTANGIARSQAFPNTWIVLRSNGYQVSTTNLTSFSSFLGISGLTSLNSVAASPTSIVIVGANAIARSTTQDLATADWTTTSIASTIFMGVAYGNSRWVAIATSGAVYTSTDDGLTWNLATTLPFQYGASQMRNSNISVGFQNGKFVYWGYTLGCYAESLDGANWQIVSYPYPTSTAGTDSAALNTLTGLFLSSTLATPTWTGYGTGITFSSSTITQTSNLIGYANVTGGGSTVSTKLMGPGDWREVQVIMRPAAAANQWMVTYSIDDWVSSPVGPITYDGTNYPWFNLSRRGAVSNFGNLVFYEFAGLSDPVAMLGPDLRIYTEHPTSDELAQWNRSDGTTSNAQAVATGTVTNATTNISESGLGKTDQYQVSTSMPNTVKVLSVQNEAYFSRMLPNTTYVSVGTQVDGQNTDSVPVQVSSPVASWAYVNQRLDQNPTTGSNWTAATASASRMRIIRASNDPQTVALIHCDGVQGATSVPYAINVGNGSNVALNGAVVTTADSKFGGSCIQIPVGGVWNFSGAFGGPGNNLGTNDFTIECWIKTAFSGNACAISMDTSVAGGAFGGLLLTPAGVYLSNANAAWNLSVTPSGSFNNSQWRHIALCRLGNLIYLWVDGQPATNSPAVNSGPVSVRGNAGVLALGATSGNTFAGFIDEIRVSRGCRYTTAFTPPTGPFTS